LTYVCFVDWPNIAYIYTSYATHTFKVKHN